MHELDPGLAAVLAKNAAVADGALDWPAESWSALTAVALQWCVPRRLGGRELPAGELLAGYGEIARRCLTTAFILSQREASIRYLMRGANTALIDRLVPALAAGAAHITLGVSQLTTSRQHGAPALCAEPANDGVRLNGVMPWVTAADQADFVLAGAVLPDGKQLLAVVPTDSPGLAVGPPLELLALRGSRTAEVRCVDVFVPTSEFVAGPIDNVMAEMKGGTGGLETTALALGLVAGAADWLDSEGTRTGQSELGDWRQRIEGARSTLAAWLMRLAGAAPPSEDVARLRAQANLLALAASDAVLTFAKGAGFVAQHPAERLVRQARFFLVWSCPKPAAAATLDGIGRIAGPAT